MTIDLSTVNMIVMVGKLLASMVTILSFSLPAYVYFANSKKERIKNTQDYWENFYSSKQEKIADSHFEYPEVYSGTFDKVSASEIGRAKVHDILNGFERLALGVNLGVYNLNTLNKVAGCIIVSLYQTYEPYILKRKHADAPNSWVEFEILSKKLEKKRVK